MASQTTIPDHQPTTWELISSYNKSFWCANTMEMIERWAYYGVRAVLSLYIVDAVANGGLEFTHIQKGMIYSWWAVIQSLLPMFTGGFSDRFGYKKTIAFSISVKVAGYLLMATQTSFWGFFTGCMLLATGTAIFKPGVQGIVAHNTHDKSSGLGWGIFYMLVNIGGFLGPVTAGFLRMMSWKYVFFANAALVALNYVTLLLFKEPEVDRTPNSKGFIQEFGEILWMSFKEICTKPRLWTFVLIFSGFWLMFNQLFDLLPNFIDDWVNTASLAAAAAHIPGFAWLGQLGHVPPEWMINIDAGAIVLFMIPIAAWYTRISPLLTMNLGFVVSIVGLLLSASSMSGWVCAAGIFVFAVGEMLASPLSSGYLGEMAPADKKGLYLGYANVPLAIGWGIGSDFGGHLYEDHGDKVNMARNWLQSHGMTADAVKAIPKEKVMDTLAAQMHSTVPQATQVLWNLNHPDRMWYFFAGLGFTSLVGLVIYDIVIKRIDKQRELSKVIGQANGAETGVAL